MRIILTLLLFAIFIKAFTQNDKNNANIWYFGQFAGIDFNQSPPVALTDGTMNTAEGCAVVCNKFGDLLFYTDGNKVWDRNHNIMPNGNGLMGNYSASQSSIIVPQYSDTNRYYIFTVDARENNLNNGLRYSVVDMTWNNGFGDVTFEKNILLHDPVCEKVCAVYSVNYPDMWIIAHEYGTNSFLAYRLNNSGIQPPIISNIGSIHQDANQLSSIGYLKSSPLGNKIAVGIRGLDKYEIFDFNNATGVISNPITTGYFYWAYGLEFSTNGNRLYLAHRDTKEFVYLDLNAGSALDILNSETYVGSSTANYIGALQMGPDGNIYVSKRYENFVGAIKDIDSSSPYYIDNEIFLSGKISEWGLPNIFYYKGWTPVQITGVNKPIGNVYAYYNSLNKSLNFEINISQNDLAKIEIFDIHGLLVYSLEEKSLLKGYNSFSIPLLRDNTEVLFYRITTSRSILNDKVLISN